jgi:hypothetical protein
LLRVKPGLESFLAEFVIEFAFLIITQDVMGERNLFEAFFGLFVPLINVGMILSGELPVGLFDLLG